MIAGIIEQVVENLGQKFRMGPDQDRAGLGRIPSQSVAVGLFDPAAELIADPADEVELFKRRELGFGVGSGQEKQSLDDSSKACLLYTSPSPRD